MSDHYDKLSDAVLKQIAYGSGRTYPYEGRAMARELLEFRKQRDAAAPTISPAQTPYPWGGAP